MFKVFIEKMEHGTNRNFPWGKWAVSIWKRSAQFHRASITRGRFLNTIRLKMIM